MLIKRIALLILICSSVCLPSKCQTVQFTNGQWFDGSGFQKQTWYSVHGTLTKTRPGKIEVTINLENGFVIPPFGEAHNHNVSADNASFKSLSDRYLKAGIFYVKNPNALKEDKTILNDKRLINHPRAIDAVFAVGGLTSTNGHPGMFYSSNPSKGEGNFFHFIDSEREVEAKWEVVTRNKPDFIKTFLLFSEEFEIRNGNSEFVGNTGLNPSLLPLIVRKAHAGGYRVAAHVETAHDFHVAIESGVDEIAHMPGFRGDPKLGVKMPPEFEKRFTILQEDAALAAKNKVVVTTTLGDFVTIPKLFELRRKGDLLHKTNLTTLKDAGVVIVLGSDAYEKNSMIELSYLRYTGVFSELELLKIFCESTPQSIFPERKLGKLSDGYEASFVVLKQNPLRNSKAYQNIIHWVKQGELLDNQLVN